MKRVPLYAMAHARSGDKGDGSNVGVLAYDDRGYEILKAWLTPDRVKAHFGEIVNGRVDRYDLPNLRALNFVIENALGGGVTRSLRQDMHGKSLSSLMLTIELPGHNEETQQASGSCGAVAARPGEK